jgi:hypothetical protein
VLALTVAAIAFTHYRAIAEETARLEAISIRTYVDDESLSEVGYIVGVEDETRWGLEARFTGWWVEVPAENVRYWCSWEGGYRGFRKGSAVRLIHKRAGLSTSDYSGYIVGLTGAEYGRSAEVSAEDEFDVWLDEQEDPE